MLHALLQVYFGWVRDFGYAGVFVLMALESSIFPVPSEVVVPPAAYWAAQGRLSLTGVVVSATLGSLFGSLVTYLVARAVGRPLVARYGRYVGMPESKVALAEVIVARHGALGIFLSRLLPVVRHLCSIPAGLARMSMVPFVVWTTVGAALWCGVLAWFGHAVIGDQPALLEDPAALRQVLHDRLLWFVAAVGLLGGLYAAVRWYVGRAEGASAVPPGST